jgi:hypothetical protein|tara:strand:- start:277 stop:1638 length:1362 start_codon:yes stop_codon:yes gene_type:complete
MTTGLFTEIVIELKEKASKIPPKIMNSVSIVSAFVKKFTTNPFNYAVLQSIIFVILILVITLRDPYDLYANKPLHVTMGVLFIFFLMFITYFFIDHRKSFGLINDKSLWKIFVKKIFSLIALALAIVGVVLLGLLIIKRVPQITNITAFIFRAVIVTGVVAIGYILYKRFSNSSAPDKKNRLIKLLIDILLYIPCILIDTVEFIKAQWKITTKTEWLILGGEVVFIGMGYILPIIYQKLVTHDGQILLKEPKYLSNKYELGTYQNLNPSDNTGDVFKYSYSITGWFNIYGMAPNMRASANEFTDIINYSNKPKIQFNVSTNTLRIQTELSHHMHPHTNDANTDEHHDKQATTEPLSTSSKTFDVFITDDIVLQKWNNIVINYDSGYMDVFLNGELVGTKGTVSPYMKFDVVSAGANRGIEGGICNVVYYDRILSKGEIDINYNLLSELNPPLL